MITLPKLLDSSGNETERLRPAALSISERIIPLSTASMTLPEGQSIPDRSYIELFTPNGSAGIYRSRAPRTGYRQNSEYHLEHAVCEVGDWLVRAEIEKTSKTLSQALTQVFSYYGGIRWQLGTVSASGNVILAANYSNLLQTMNNLIAQVHGAVMTFDFTTTPWTINVGTLPDTVAAEGRISRNILSAEIRKDDGELCTRVWMSALDGGKMDAASLETYGVIEKRLSGDYTAAEAEIVAEAYLAKYSEPSYTVTIGGVDFSAVTGETMDRVAIGKLYRLAIPDQETAIEKNIVAIEWTDLVNAPEVATVTLSEPESTIVDFIHRQEKSLSGAGGYYETQEAVNNGLRNDIAESASQVTEQLREELQESASQIEASVAQQIIVVQTEVEAATSGIHSFVYANNSQIWSSVTQTASMIRTEVHNDLSNFYTMIMQSASGVVIRTGDNTKTFNQLTAPAGTAQTPLVDGDVWFKNAGQFTWGDAANKYWLDDTAFNWSELKTSEIYRYDGTIDDWVKVQDERGILQDTKFEQTKEKISMVAARVDVVDGNVESYRAEFNVRADQIDSHVAEQVNGLRTDIVQTANEIRSSASAANSQLYSELIQTASNIRSTVNNQIDGVRSDIEQTANQIRTSVSASNSQLYSYIQQTATNISMVVVNTESGLRSELSITASQIRSEVSNSVSELRGSITVESNRISLVVEGTGANAKIKPAAIVAAINDGASSIIISADHINLDGYVKATDITADFINGKLSNISTAYMNTVHINTLYVDTNIYAPNGNSIYALGLQSISLSQSGNTYTLKQTTLNGTESTIGTFSRATTLSGAWSSGVFTASASPQGNTLTTSLTVGQFTWSGYVATAKIYATIGSSGTVYDTGKEASLDVSGVFTRVGSMTLYSYNSVTGQYYSQGSHDWYYR